MPSERFQKCHHGGASTIAVAVCGARWNSRQTTISRLTIGTGGIHFSRKRSTKTTPATSAGLNETLSVMAKRRSRKAIPRPRAVLT